MASLVSWLAYDGAHKSDGTAVASGSAYFYQPGTTSTQVAVYSDKDGLTTATQPVALDAGGRAEVYTKVACRIEIQDSTGTAVRVEDRANTVVAAQVEVENAGFTGTSLTTGQQAAGGRTDLNTALTNIAGSINGMDGAYKEAGSTTSRPLYKAVGRWISTADFGAAGDDATDDTTALQSAITRAMTANKPLWIEPGTYRITSALTVTGATGASLVIEGAGRAECTIKNMSTSNNALTIDLSSAIESHIILRNFSVTANTTSSGTAISVANGDGIFIERVGVALHRTGFGVSAVSHAHLSDCSVVSTDSNAAGIGFRLGASAEAHKCRATQTNGKGFSFEGTFSRALFCRAAITTGTGFDFGANDTTAYGCVAAGTTTGFNVGAFARAGTAFCTSTDGSTADYATNASTTLPVELNCTFTTRTLSEVAGIAPIVRQRVLVRNRTASSSGSNFSYTPDPTKGELQVLSYTAFATITITIGATATTGLIDGQQMMVVLENAQASAGTQTLSWNAQYKGGSLPANLTASIYSVVPFTWKASSSIWVAGPVATNIANGAASFW